MRQVAGRAGRPAVVTSPNVECVSGRLKFLRTGNLRDFNEHGDPKHITPIVSRFYRLEEVSGYQLEAQFPGPSERRFHGARAVATLVALCLGPILRWLPWGDCNIFILRVP